MFGNWGQNQQNQQQQQQPQQPAGGIFGQPAQPSAFGSTGFGQTSAFGASSQPSAFGASTTAQQQPAAGFGGFGQAAKPGFGATGGIFGQSTTTPAATSTFGGFGANNATGFGATNNAAAGGGLFGAKPAATGAFGSTSIATTQNGTASPTYAPTQEREGTTGVASNYNSITAMPAYRNFSFEELRMQDYAAGRKTASGTGFGTTNAFGAAPAAGPAAGGFGQPSTSTGIFGQPAAATTTNTFGQPSTTTSTFGQPAQPTSGFGGFGQTNTTSTTTGGLFGQPQQQPQPQQPAAGGFGQPAQTNAFGGASAFGQSTQPATGGLFGSTTTNTFGQNTANKPTFGFGAAATTQPAQQATTGFGGFGTTNTNAGGGLFGQPQQNQQQQQQQQQQPATGFGGFGTASAFGANNAATNPTQPTGGLFGQPAQPAGDNKPAGFGFGGGGLFGQQNQNQQQQQQQQQPATGLFGQPAQQQAQPATGGLFGGAFGQNNQQQQQQQQPAQQTSAFGTSLFAPKPQQPTTTGLFGNAQTAQQPAPATGGLFGNTQPGGGGLFGANNTQQQQQPTGGLFGQKPAGGLFGSTAPAQATQPTGGLFGSTLGASTTTNSLFGPKPVGLGQQPLQGSLIASVDGNIYNTNPLLAPANNSTSAHIITLNDSDKGKALAYSKKYIPKVATPKVGRLRGFATPPPIPDFDGRPSSPFNRPLSANASRLGTSLGGLSDSASSSAGLNPDAFRPRSSVKKLVLPMRVDPSQPLESPLEHHDSLGLSQRTKVTWDPQLGSAARETTLLNSQNGFGSPRVTTTPRTGGPKTLFGAPSPHTPSNNRAQLENETPSKPVSVLKSKGTTSSDPKNKAGEYWTEPSISELRELGYDKLTRLENFKVHRTGFGDIHFLEPVNLVSVKSIDEIPGNYVAFDHKECIVYPNEADKPPMGEGLNVPARISLHSCYPLDKSTRQLITDPNYDKLPAHIRKLKAIPDTQFENYEPTTGTWTFLVPHFTRYGVDDDDDDEEDEDEVAGDILQPETFTPDGSPVKRSDATAPAPRTPTPEEDISEMIVGEQASPSPSPEGSPDPEEYSDEDIQDAEADSDHPASRPWASTLGLDPQRVNVMQASFFHTSAPSEEEFREQPRKSLFAVARSDEAVKGGAPLQQRLFPTTTSTAAPVLPPPPPLPQPLRELEPVKYEESLAFGSEGAFVDAGFAMARSFRVGWGPNGLLVHCGKICGPKEAGVVSSSTINVERMRVLAGSSKTETEQASRLLHFQVEHTDIEIDEEGIPYAAPRRSLTFGQFSGLFKGDDRSPEASVWRLGSALFDQRDLQLAPTVSGDIRDLVHGVRFKAALSEWLEETVSPAVEADLRQVVDEEAKIFSLLTGHQVGRAAEAAMRSRNHHLAMLLAQAGGDLPFRTYLSEQVAIWKEQGVDAFISKAYIKCCTLLSGEVKGMGLKDWKRVFGLWLWYGTTLDDGVDVAMSEFLSSLEARPVPWYVESPTEIQWKGEKEPLEDGLWHLMSLAFDRRLPLEKVTMPRGFSPSPLDFRVPWHLYVLLEGALQVRDFSDREAMLGQPDVRATSVCAAMLTMGYAEQLEAIGQKEQALFVLLHLEMPQGRTNTIKQLLARHAGEWNEKELVEGYLIPSEWIAEANGVQARYENRLWDAFHFFIQGRQQDLAHEIALNDLAPEIIIRGDMVLLSEVFSAFEASEVRNWNEYGKLFLQFAQSQVRVPKLLQSLQSDRENNAVPDASEQLELRDFGLLVPSLLENLPKAFEHRTELRHRVCLATMLGRLINTASALRANDVESRAHVHSALLSEQTRLQHVQASSLERFSNLLSAVTAN